MWGKYHLIRVRAWFAHSLVCVTGLREGEEIFLALFHPGCYQSMHKMKPEQNNVFCCETCLSPLALVTPIIPKKLNCQMFISLEKASGGAKQKKEHICVNAGSPNLFIKTFHYSFFFFCGFVGGGVLWQKYITAAALSGDCTTGFMWRQEDWSSCNRLFLFPFATPPPHPFAPNSAVQCHSRIYWPHFPPNLMFTFQFSL